MHRTVSLNRAILRPQCHMGHVVTAKIDMGKIRFGPLDARDATSVLTILTLPGRTTENPSRQHFLFCVVVESR